MTTERVAIDGAAGRLDARLHVGGGRFLAVVLHPHPQYGGDMENHVVVACCDALERLGADVLRLNFRGVGRSEGSYDGGKGEADDARAAIAFMRERQPDVPLLLVGYSFGAMIACAVATEDLSGLVLISPPVGAARLPALPVHLPVLIVAGDSDPISDARVLLALASATVHVDVVEGVDHGWWPGIDLLHDAVMTFAGNVGHSSSHDAAL